MVGVVHDVCISFQQFCGESSGADTLADKVVEHHGLSFATNNGLLRKVGPLVRVGDA